MRFNFFLGNTKKTGRKSHIPPSPLFNIREAKFYKKYLLGMVQKINFVGWRVVVLWGIILLRGRKFEGVKNILKFNN